MSMYLTDEMLAQAAKNVGETMLASLPDPEDCRHAVSPEFERSMERLIQKAKRKTRIRRCLQSIAVAALAVVIGLSAWLAVDTEARAAMVEWVRTVYEDSIVYEFFHPGAVEDDSSYRLGWVPDGYALLQEETGELMYIAVYQRESEVIYFTYGLSDEYNQAEFIPGNSDTEPVSVYGNPGEFYEANDESETNELVWFDSEQGILFALSSDLDQETMLKMAESVTAE